MIECREYYLKIGKINSKGGTSELTPMEDVAVRISDLEDRLRLRSEECDLLRDDLKNSTAELVEMQSKLREGRDSVSKLTS